LARAIGQIAQANFWILGLDADGARSLAEARPAARTALVLGAEGAGLRRLTREACDEIVRLPIAHNMDSLNVSNAAAVALYELVRDRGDGG
jgi:23S rRNA (guanosine2251-2'-O)-methyltransferase